MVILRSKALIIDELILKTYLV